jgi:hypothetical protein
MRLSLLLIVCVALCSSDIGTLTPLSSLFLLFFLSILSLSDPTTDADEFPLAAVKRRNERIGEERGREEER